MPGKNRKILRFSIQSRLLQELGERLVSSPDVAISELIKNAYDADSPICDIEYKPNKYLIIRDRGHGMTLDDLRNRWMAIATGQKVKELFSPKYRRVLTGSKGVGRFAVRSLGNHLQLTTTAYVPEKGYKTTILAKFDWSQLDKTHDLLKLEIPYEIHHRSDEPTGTTLKITRLNTALSEEVFTRVRSEVLRMASPLSALRPREGVFAEGCRGNAAESGSEDPGFEITINGRNQEDEGPASRVLEHYVGRVAVSLEGKRLVVEADFREHGKKRIAIKLESGVGTPVYADIRYFPKRKGVFSQIGIDGRSAWSWIRENHGIGIYDKCFRVRPYGMDQDDWLMLDRDSAHNRRDWRTRLANEHFPISDADKADPARNPMVNLITNFQVVGAVFVNTRSRLDGDSQHMLVPSMDRQGFVENEAFKRLRMIIRFAIEFLTNEDKKIQLRLEEEERKRKREELKRELRQAIEEIESSKTLNRSDKKRIITQYETFYHDIRDLEEYDRRARQGLELMGFLGVLAGFMTHEHQSALYEMEQITALLDQFSRQDARFGEAAERIRSNIKRIGEHVEYTRLFIKGINTPVNPELCAKPRIRHAIKPLQYYVKEQGYKVVINADDKVLMPAVPIAMYEGVVLNLFSNALKALVAAPDCKDPVIRICAWTDAGHHYLTVCDNGVGIPEKAKNRIWDPLFTTTSSLDNPLGSGMGLGLPLVKRVLETNNGKIELIPPSNGFKTCFKATFPRVTRYGRN